MKLNKVLILLILIGLSIPNILFVNADTTNELTVTFTENPKIVSPGTNGYIELNLKSGGTGGVSDVTISATSWDYSTVIPQGNWNVYVGNLNGGDSTSVLYEFKISDSATPGLYQVVFKIEYYPGHYIKQTVIIKVEDSTILDIVSVEPSSIDIGQETKIVFNISNSGGKTAGNILFTWDDPNNLILPVGSDNRITISSINAGDFREVPIDVVATPSATPGVYPINIAIEYYDQTGTKQTISSTVGMQIGGTTDFEIILQQSTTSSTTFAITNTGANVASSVIVSIPSQVNYIASGTSSVSLGNLDAGDYTLASFQISSSSVDFNSSLNSNNTQRPSFNGFPGDMPSDFNFSNRDNFMNRSSGGFAGNGNLIIEISYTDLFGIRQTVEKEVEMAATSISSSTTTSDFATRFGNSGFSDQSSDTSDSGTTYVIIGVVGIISIVTVLQLAKRKNIPYISKILKGRNK